MLVSHRFGFILIKTSKTAGTSIETAIQGACEGRRRKKPETARVATPHLVVTQRNPSIMFGEGSGSAARRRVYGQRGIPSELTLFRRIRDLGRRREFDRAGLTQHATPTAVRAYVGDKVWDSYQKLIPVRNPFTRAVSEFIDRNWKLGQDMSKLEQVEFQRQFEEFAAASEPSGVDREVCDMSDIRLIRFEQLPNSLNEALAGLVPDEFLALLDPLPRVAARRRPVWLGRPSDAFTERAVIHVRRNWSSWFESFGYSRELEV